MKSAKLDWIEHRQFHIETLPFFDHTSCENWAHKSIMPCCAVITLPPHQHQTDKPSQLEVCGGDRERGCVSGSGMGCEITTITSVCKESKNWLKCCVNGQCHSPLLFCSSLPPTETSISSPQPDSRSVSPPAPSLHTVSKGWFSRKQTV